MNYWNEVAHDFDRLYNPEYRAAYAMNHILRRGLFQRTEIACEVIQQLGAPSVLDVGCGSGRNILSFLQAGAREVTGIDSAEGMLEIARQITAPAGSRVKLIPGDFLAPKNSLRSDVVVALGVFDYLHEEAMQFLMKMKESADRAVVFSAPGRSLLRMPLRAWRYRRSGVAVHFYRHQELAVLCRHAGFSKVSIRPVHSSGYVVVGWNT